ncbi:MAG TPA: biotin/lipoyl-containing protein [Bacteroidota bacterium]|nr:biotin/lipoyl-containing protein [Bacteroidota bacterium]
MRTFIVSAGGTEFTVELGSDGHVKVDGKIWSVRRISPTEFSVIAGQRQIRVVAAPDGESYSVIAGGYRAQLSVESERERLLRTYGRSTASSGQRRELHAPMPAMVIRIDVAPGDEVRPGQPLVVLEAMKMENEIVSPGEGRVKEVHAKAGKPVEKGELLITFQ